MTTPRANEEWLQKGSALLESKHYEEALQVYEQTLVYYHKSKTLVALRRYSEATDAYHRAQEPGYKGSHPILNTNGEQALVDLLSEVWDFFMGWRKKKRTRE